MERKPPGPYRINPCPLKSVTGKARYKRASCRRNIQRNNTRDWTELLTGDKILATAILDRLLHRADVLNIRGRSYRLRDLEESLKP